MLRKSIKPVYIYKWMNTGKRYVHWDSYGYGSLGGRAFSTDTGKRAVLANRYGTPAEPVVPETSKFPSDENWEVECAPFERK